MRENLTHAKAQRRKGNLKAQTADLSFEIARNSAQLNRIKAPTLILWGDNDGIFSLQDQLALDTLIPNSIFKRYSAAILPPGSRDGGHGLHVEFPQLITGDIEAFAK